MTKTRAPAKTGKKQRNGTWAKGQSGNPEGRPKGTRNRITLLAQSLLDEEAEALVKKCIASAKRGNRIALKLVMERILPPCKERTISLDLQRCGNLEETIQAMKHIIEAVAAGTIGPQEGQTLIGMLAVTVKAVEVGQLEQRLAALEMVLKSRKSA